MRSTHAGSFKNVIPIFKFFIQFAKKNEFGEGNKFFRKQIQQRVSKEAVKSKSFALLSAFLCVIKQIFLIIKHIFFSCDLFLESNPT